MKKAFAFGLFVFIFSLFFLIFQQGSVLAQVLSSGEEIFVQGKCARCHTLGRGRFVGPDLLGVGKKYSREDLIRWAQNPESIYAEQKKKPLNEGYPPMPPMNLSPDDAAEVADYLLGYTLPSGLLEQGKITGRVSNITTEKYQGGHDVALISYMGDIRKERRFEKTDSEGRFSFSSLRWDRSYELILFYRGVQYVSGKMVFSPGEDEISVDLPVYDTTDSEEKISLSSLNVIVYPDDEGNSVSVTSLYVFNNSGYTVFTGKQMDSDTVTLLFSVPKDAEDITFSGNVNPDAIVRKGEKLYDTLPFLPGVKKIALSYFVPLSIAGKKFPVSFDYEVGDLAMFARKTGLEIGVSGISPVADNILIHGDTFSKYEASDLKAGSFVVAVSGSSFLKGVPGRYLPVILFFVFVVAGVGYFLYGKYRSSAPLPEK